MSTFAETQLEDKPQKVRPVQERPPIGYALEFSPAHPTSTRVSKEYTMMKIALWHKQHDGSYQTSQTMDVASTSDLASCELAYFYTKPGGIMQLQDSKLCGLHIGDVAVIIPYGSGQDEHRAYVLESIECDTDSPIFVPCAISAMFLYETAARTTGSEADSSGS